MAILRWLSSTYLTPRTIGGGRAGGTVRGMRGSVHLTSKPCRDRLRHFTLKKMSSVHASYCGVWGRTTRLRTWSRSGRLLSAGDHSAGPARGDYLLPTRHLAHARSKRWNWRDGSRIKARGWESRNSSRISNAMPTPYCWRVRRERSA